jgi:hypothetical protein
MGVTAARHSYGSNLQTDFAGGTNYATCGEIMEIDGPQGSVTSSDATNLLSPSARKEFLPGLVDEGELTLTIRWKNADYNNFRGSFRTTLNWKILWALAGTEVTNANATFRGFVTKLPNKIPADAVIDCPGLVIKITGVVTFTQAS